MDIDMSGGCVGADASTVEPDVPRLTRLYEYGLATRGEDVEHSLTRQLSLDSPRVSPQQYCRSSPKVCLPHTNR